MRGSFTQHPPRLPVATQDCKRAIEPQPFNHNNKQKKRKNQDDEAYLTVT